MKKTIELNTIDNHKFDAYILRPDTKPKGGVVIIQEIFGVNDHIKNVAERFSKEGFVTWVPDIFYRIEDGISLGYSATDIEKGKNLKDKSGWELPTMDILSCIANLKVSYNVATIGFCYGGSLSWKAACSAYGLDASVCFYGSQISNFLDKNPRCPTMVHLAEEDPTINKEDQNKIIEFSKNKEPNIKVYTYESSDHGFFCDARDSYNEKARDLSYERTIEFLKKSL